MLIRHATLDDLDALSTMENACFPPQDAADQEKLAARIEAYPDHFWLLINTDPDKQGVSFPARVEEGPLVSFINGPASQDPDITDPMFSDVSMHDERGAWQMILGIDTAPVYQHHGCGGYLLRRVILDSALNGRKGIVLVCREKLVKFYHEFGFMDEKISPSTRSNTTWHQMRLLLNMDEQSAVEQFGDDAPEALELAHDSISRAMRETTQYIDREEAVTVRIPVLSRR